MSETNAAKLSEYDFTIVIDTSGSMSEPVKAGSTTTRWKAVQESAITLIRDVEQIDTDGLGMVLFGSQVQAFENVGVAKARDVFGTVTPRGGTPLAEALTEAIKLAGKSAKKDVIVVFTDGVPDDQAAAAAVLKNAANAQEKDEDLTILFVQVGDNAEASAYLKSLDDELKDAKFDIVDAKTVAEVDKFSTTQDLILAAITD